MTHAVTAVSRDATLWAARQVVRQQRELPPTGPAPDPAPTAAVPPPPAVPGCAQCDGSDPDCWMLLWALAEERAAASNVNYPAPAVGRAVCTL